MAFGFTSHRVQTPADLNALIGARVMEDTPEIFWEDTHGYFQFHSDAEARLALRDPYYQQFLPELDWEKTSIREVQHYPCYCTDAALLWRMAERATTAHGPLLLWREHGSWHAAFSSHADAKARTPGVAICLAVLRALGHEVEVNHDRLDALLERTAEKPRGE